MHVVCNNALLYVVDYPAQDAVEVFDKRRGRGGLMRDATARQFRDGLRHLAEGATEEDLERFMDHYDALLNQALVYH